MCQPVGMVSREIVGLLIDMDEVGSFSRDCLSQPRVEVGVKCAVEGDRLHLKAIALGMRTLQHRLAPRSLPKGRDDDGQRKIRRVHNHLFQFSLVDAYDTRFRYY